MKIAVAANGCDAESTVASMLSDAAFLLIADMDSHTIIEALPKADKDPENCRFAELTVDRNCESIICGPIEKAAFDILADACVTRSKGSGLTVTDALNCESMLPLITDHIGGVGCGGHEH